MLRAVLLYLCTSLLAIFTFQPSSAAVGANQSGPSFFSEAAALPTPRHAPVVANLERTLEARWVAVEEAFPVPPLGSPPVLIAKRLTALRELNDFANMTLQGLTRAVSVSEEQSIVERELQDVIDHWDLKISGSVWELLEHPDVAGEGWFTISRFGEQADRDAALLVKASDHDPVLQYHVLNVLKALATHGETSADTVNLLVHRVSAASGKRASYIDR